MEESQVKVYNNSIAGSVVPLFLHCTYGNDELWRKLTAK